MMVCGKDPGSTTNELEANGYKTTGDDDSPAQPTERSTIVQKFSGTCIGSADRMVKVADIVRYLRLHLPSSFELLLSWKAGKRRRFEDYALFTCPANCSSIPHILLFLCHGATTRQNLEQHKVIVVLGALNGGSHGEGTTSSLFNAAHLALRSAKKKKAGTLNSATSSPIAKHGWPSYLGLVASLERSHIGCLRRVMPLFQKAEAAAGGSGGAVGSRGDQKTRHSCDYTVAEEAERDILIECETLREFLNATQTLGELTPRSLDYIVGTGEKLAAIIFAAVLRVQGMNAMYVNLDKIMEDSTVFLTNLLNTSGSHHHHQTYNILEEASTQIGEALNNVFKTARGGDCIPIVTGFFGPFPNSLLRTLGPSYTDVTASLCATGVGAHELQVFGDGSESARGFFTAQPSVVPNAKLLTLLHPSAASSLAHLTAKCWTGGEAAVGAGNNKVGRDGVVCNGMDDDTTIIHPDALDWALQSGVNVRVLSTSVPSTTTESVKEGTFIPCFSHDPLDGNADTMKADALKTLRAESTLSAPPSFSFLRTLSSHALAATMKESVLVLTVRANRNSPRSPEPFATSPDGQSPERESLNMSTSESTLEPSSPSPIANEKASLDDTKSSPRSNSKLESEPASFTTTHNFLHSVFTILSQHRLSVEVVSSSEANVSVAVGYCSGGTASARGGLLDAVRGEGSSEKGGDLACLYGPLIGMAIEKLRTVGDVSVQHDRCVLSLIGTVKSHHKHARRELDGSDAGGKPPLKAHSVNGANVATVTVDDDDEEEDESEDRHSRTTFIGRMFETLAKHKINIEMLSQGRRSDG
ncbi:Aspartokinase, partial [Quaeritorhiza haematococci]